MTNNFITKGAEGEQVQALQQMLQQYGYLSPEVGRSIPYGYFGDMTEAALKQFQSAKGIKPDGVYGAMTRTALENSQYVDNLLQQSQGTPQGVILQNMVRSGDLRVYDLAKAVSLGNGVQITPELFDVAQRRAEQEVSKYYEDLAKQQNVSYETEMGEAMRQYEQGSQDIAENFNQTVNTQNEAEGRAGTWASSAREERLNALTNRANRQLEDLYSKTSSNLSLNALNQEYNMGGGKPIFLNKYSLTPTNKVASTAQIYKPQDFYGRYPTEKQSYINTTAKKSLADYMENPSKYL